VNPVLPDTLAAYVPFHVFKGSQLAFLSDQCLRLYARKGQVLLGPGSQQEQAYFLMSGEICNPDSGEMITANFPHALHLKYRTPDTWVAQTDCSLFQIERQLLERFVCSAHVIKYLQIDIAYQRQFDEHGEWIHTLLESNLFHKISPLNLQGILSHMTAVPVSRGQTVIRQGDSGDCCYFVRDGVATITRVMEGSNSPVVLAEIGIGQCFGEDALLHDTVRNATVTMISDGVLMRLDKRGFLHLLREPTVDMLLSSDLDMALQTGSSLLDVRTEEEFLYNALSGALSMPLDLLRVKSRMLDAYKSYVVYCDTDLRSRAAVFLLGQLGIRARALAGGLDGPPTFPARRFACPAGSARRRFRNFPARSKL